MNDTIRQKINEAQREIDIFSTPHTIGEIMETASEMGYQVDHDEETVWGWVDSTPEGQMEWRLRSRIPVPRCW